MYIRQVAGKVFLGSDDGAPSLTSPPALPAFAWAGCRAGPRREAVGKPGLLVGAPRSGGARACPTPCRFLGGARGRRPPPLVLP